MTPESHLLELYQQWRALTQAETAAIQEGNWGRLLETQDQKKLLQERIDAAEAERRCSAEWQGRGDVGLKETLHELILLEQQNAAALEARREELKSEQREMESSRGNLRQIRRAYAACPQVVWQSYS